MNLKSLFWLPILLAFAKGFVITFFGAIRHFDFSVEMLVVIVGLGAVSLFFVSTTIATFQTIFRD